MGLKRASDIQTEPSRPAPLERGYDEWIDALLTGEASARRVAASALAEHPQACRTLCERLDRETDDSVRVALFNSVVMIGGAEAITGLMPLLRSEDPTLRNAAIEAMSELPDSVAPAIDRLLQDADPDVRIFTVNILGLLKHPRVEEWLIAVLMHDDDVNTVGTAIDALAEVGTGDALAALATAARRFSAHPFIGFSADVARERIESA